MREPQDDPTVMKRNLPRGFAGRIEVVFAAFYLGFLKHA